MYILDVIWTVNASIKLFFFQQWWSTSIVGWPEPRSSARWRRGQHTKRYHIFIILMHFCYIFAFNSFVESKQRKAMKVAASPMEKKLPLSATWAIALALHNSTTALGHRELTRNEIVSFLRHYFKLIFEKCQFVLGTTFLRMTIPQMSARWSTQN